MVLAIILCTAIVMVLTIACIISLRSVDGSDPKQITRTLAWLAIFYLGLQTGVLIAFILT
jgi:hypothetical protein